MSDYPQLTEMGVTHPQQIDRYMVNSISNFDVLRILYRRQKGSLLPVSRTYEFPRVQRSFTNRGGQTETVMETAPELRAATDELKQLLEAKENRQGAAEAILDELRQLEEEVAVRLQCIRDLVDKA